METFLAVADELHFGRAAERLHMTTSGASQAIRSLERWIGGPLFERTSRRVRLTALGQQLLDGLKPAYAEIDRVLTHVLRDRPHEIRDFSPYGYDERQYCSPGYNLGVGSLTRTPYAGYPEYHTSGDNPDFVAPESLLDTLEVAREAVAILDRNRTYVNLSPYGEPQLGKRGLYESLGGRSDAKDAQLAMLWVLNYSDGTNDLLAIADRAGLPFASVAAAADALHAAGLLKD